MSTTVNTYGEMQKSECKMQFWMQNARKVEFACKYLFIFVKKILAKIVLEKKCLLLHKSKSADEVNVVLVVIVLQ